MQTKDVDQNVFGGVNEEAMLLLQIAREFRQFETIFVEVQEAPRGRTHVRGRVFTVDEELPFAGHPVIGAAAAFHERLASRADKSNWTFWIAARPIEARPVARVQTVEELDALRQ